MHWKTVIGIFLIFGALNELFSVVMDYRSGKLVVWPWGVETAFAAIMALGIYLVIKGAKAKK